MTASSSETRWGVGAATHRGRVVLPWVGLGTWVALLIAIDILLRAHHLEIRGVTYLLIGVLASLGVVTLASFARLASSPPELRILRVLAVLLPSVFVLLVEVILYFLEVDETLTEAGEHVLGTAIVSAGAVPFSVYVFRVFSGLRDELARRAQRLQALHETSMAVAGGAGLSSLHEAVAAGAARVVGHDWGLLYLAAGRGKSEVLVVSPQAPELARNARQLVRSAATSETPKRGLVGGHAVLAVPLRHRPPPAGALAVVARTDADPAPEDELLLDMFAVAASASIENARRLEEAHLLASVEERERIARELHDELGQLLAFLTTKIQTVQELVTAGRIELTRQELAELERVTRTLSAQVREAILGLRTRLTSDEGLGRTLEGYVADFGIQAGLRTSFEGDPDAGRSLPGSSQYQLLRIAQEALSNARRHASARSVSVRLVEADGAVELSVEDDGQGFAAERRARGFGLKIMAERARALGGELDVSSQSGRGTTVRVRVTKDAR